MKRITTWALALALCAISSQATLAQGQGGGQGRRGGFGFGRQGGGMFGGGGMFLLNMPEVQKELKMTPEQVEKSKTKQAETQKATQELMQSAGGFQALRDLSQEDREKLFGKMQDIQKKAIAEVLKEDQQKRLKQLELQQQGAGALGRKEVADELKITDEQKEKIQNIQREQGQAMREAMQGIDFQNMTADERQQLQTKMQAFQKATTEKVFGVLTADQNKKWKEMTGEPFKFPAFGPGRGFGGPGGGRPGGQGRRPDAR